MKHGGAVYILTNKHHTTLYVGVTSDLETRLEEHKSKKNPNAFTARYNLDKLVYYEQFYRIEEKQSFGRSKSKGAREKRKRI